MQLGDILGKVRVQKPLAWKNLQVFPLMQPNGHDPGYAILDDLLDRKQIEVTEVTEGGHVPTIKVLNKADMVALILDGTELHGAKQNRMVKVTVIVGTGTETEIPVSCVEQGRWAYRAKGFASAKRTVAHRLRHAKAWMLKENLARGLGPRTDQGKGWDQVEDYLFKANVASRTNAMDDAFTARDHDVAEFVDRLKDLDAYGAVVAENGEIVALDLLDHRETFKKLADSATEDHHTLVHQGVAAFLKVFDDIILKDAAALQLSTQNLPDIVIIDENEFNKRVAEHETLRQRSKHISMLIGIITAEK